MNDLRSMNGSSRLRHHAAAALLAVALPFLLRGTAGRWLGQATGAPLPELPPCEANETLFPRDVLVPENTTVIDQWSALFHKRVALVIEEHIAQLKTGGACEENARIEATPALRELAADLEVDGVTQENMAAILLQYLGAYECALQTESFVTEPQVSADLERRIREQTGGRTTSVNITALGNAFNQEHIDIQRQIDLSRIALHRTLVYVSGYGRLQPLGGAVQCLLGATVDIRNALDLAAEASACMPRIWNARGSLRTISDEPLGSFNDDDSGDGASDEDQNDGNGDDGGFDGNDSFGDDENDGSDGFPDEDFEDFFGDEDGQDDASGEFTIEDGAFPSADPSDSPGSFEP